MSSWTQVNLAPARQQTAELLSVELREQSATKTWRAH